MATFDRDLGGYRYATTHFGDDLRRVALRELGDATSWADLATINGLVYPYLTDDPAAVAPGVLLTGSQLLVPAPVALAAATEDPAAVFGIDLTLSDGLLVGDGTDLVLTSGLDNFKQALSLLLQTQVRDLMFHPEYGSLAPTLVGKKAGPTENALAAFYMRSALLADPRVSDVPSCAAEVLGDQIRVVATVVAIGGASLNLDTVF